VLAQRCPELPMDFLLNVRDCVLLESAQEMSIDALVVRSLCIKPVLRRVESVVRQFRLESAASTVQQVQEPSDHVVGSRGFVVADIGVPL
jgi:hypothetical protein